MTVNDIRAMVAVVRDSAIKDHNFTKAHREEDQMYREVLECIAAGKPSSLAEASALAEEALRSQDIQYGRFVY